MKEITKNGQTSNKHRVFLQDSSSVVGAGLAGLLFSSPGLIISTITDNEAAATAYTQAGSLIETITTLGTYAAPTATKCRFKEVDATNHKGLYELQFDDARYAIAGAKKLIVTVSGATDLSPRSFEIQLSTFDLNSVAPDVNMLRISGDGPAADNMEANFDGTGYVADTAPSTQSQLSGLSNVGSAVNRPAASFTLTTGSEDANTYTATQALDAVRHELSDTAGVFEGYYEFNIGAGSPSSVQITGYITGPNDDLDIYGYDWITAAWVQIGNIQGSSSTSNQVNSFDMFVDMVGSGSNLGVVRVRLYKASGLTTALLAIDQIFVAFNQGIAGYDGGAIWVDTALSNTNTVVGVDGTATNPVSTMGAANTLAAATNLNIFQIAPNSTITLATSQTNQVFRGDNWNLELGGQDISGSHFYGSKNVSGTGTGTSSANFHDCFTVDCTLPPSHLTECGLGGTLTVGSAGDFILDDCHSHIAGSGTPVIDTGAAIGNVNLAMANYHNGIEIRNLNTAGTDLFSISGIGQIIYAASSSGTVHQRGGWKVTNTGGVTIVTDDNTTGIGNLPDGVKKNTALPGFTFSMLNAADGKTLESGLTITSQRSIDGGAFASTTNSASEIGVTGIYTIDLSAADLNGDTITLYLTSAGALATVLTLVTNE